MTLPLRIELAMTLTDQFLTWRAGAGPGPDVRRRTTAISGRNILIYGSDASLLGLIRVER